MLIKKLLMLPKEIKNFSLFLLQDQIKSLYIEQKKLERKVEIDQLRKEQEEPKIKFENVKKDLNCGMGFVDPHKPIHQNGLGHSQRWRFKKQKIKRYYH